MKPIHERGDPQGLAPTARDRDELAVVTPSFRSDAGLFAELHASVVANTAQAVVHHVVVPPADAHLFRQFEGDRCRVWTHRDLLPRHYVSVPHASGLALNLRRPWPPVRGWVVQQLMKLAATAALDTRAVLVIDSDAVLLREPTPAHFNHDGGLRHFRMDAGVVAGMDRHLLWHEVGRKLLSVPGVASPPAPDYVSPIGLWDPVVVRSMLDHIAETTGRNWMDAVASELHVSEFMLYGIFVDHVLGGLEPFEGPLCHNYYERVPLDGEAARAFAEQTPSDALGAMISSHSHTPHDVRRETFRRCAQRVGGGSWHHRIASRPSWDRRCLDAAVMLLAQLSAAAPAL